MDDLQRLPSLVPPSNLTYHPHRKRYLPQHLTEERRRKWRRIRWPYGIKADLARRATLDLPRTDIVLYREFIGDCREFLIRRSSKLPFGDCIRINEWYFPHPSRVDPLCPKWTCGVGFTIPGCEADIWAQCLNKLLQIEWNEANSNLFVAEIQWGDRLPEGRFSSIRFYPHISDHGIRSYVIRNFTWHTKLGRYIPRKTHVYWGHESKLGEELFKGIRQLAFEYRQIQKPIDGALSLEMEAINVVNAHLKETPSKGSK